MSAFKDEWFEDAYPSIISAIKRIVSQAAGDDLRLREDIFDDLVFRIGEDLSQWDYKDALALSGRQPFNMWDASKMRAAE